MPSNKTESSKGIFKVDNGKVLKGRMILEVPEQKAKISPKVLDYANDHNIKIRDIKGKSYNIVMKTIFNSTWVGNHICTEEATLSQLDGYNKTRYSRRKNKEGLLELASREAHEKQEVYFATILNDDDSPYCAIESNAGYFGLDFLRDNYDNFLLYEYREYVEHPGKLFLRGIFLFECKSGTTERMRRIDYTYAQDGSFKTIIYQGEMIDGTYEEIIAKHPPISAEELDKLLVDYPKFGEYDQLIRLDRIPKGALERILEYTDKEFPAFRQYLQRDIERYQEPKK